MQLELNDLSKIACPAKLVYIMKLFCSGFRKVIWTIGIRQNL